MSVRYRAAAIQLLPLIFIAALATAAAAVVALVGRKRKRAAAWFGACAVLVACGVLLLQSWNRVMLRVNQMAPATQAAR
jgi:TRAP-type C4-dicarboxylate transport system permease small subunit